MPKPFENIAISLSGGGYRATAFHLGALSYLNQLPFEGTPLLHNVKIISTISGGTFTGVGYVLALTQGDYIAIGGRIGAPATIVAAANTPFRRGVDIDGTWVDIRMESWLAADTIRRMGFGHVIAGRHHSLIVERGVSFVALDRSGAPRRSGYAAGIFAAEPRYLCYR